MGEYKKMYSKKQRKKIVNNLRYLISNPPQCACCCAKDDSSVLSDISICFGNESVSIEDIFHVRTSPKPGYIDIITFDEKILRVDESYFENFIE